MTKLETRAITTQLRADGSGDKPVVEGYGSLFGILSRPLDGFREIVMPSAFTKTLKTLDEDDDDYDPDRCVKLTYNHDPSAMLLGSTRNKSLQLRCDEKGLHFRCQLSSAISAHRDVWNAVRQNLLGECSFAFKTDDVDGDDWSEAQDDDGTPYVLRRLKNVRLYDCAIVQDGAYPNTSVAARNVTAYTPAEVGDKMRKIRAARIGEQLSREARAREQRFPTTDEERRKRAEEIGQQIYESEVRQWLAPKKFPE
ncbi:MAG: HK97 family phage prohead protease [Terriglobales bacterium]